MRLEIHRSALLNYLRKIRRIYSVDHSLENVDEHKTRPTRLLMQAGNEAQDLAHDVEFQRKQDNE